MKRVLVHLVQVASVGAVVVAVFAATETAQIQSASGLSSLSTSHDEMDRHAFDLAEPTPCPLAMRSGIIVPLRSGTLSTQLDEDDFIECKGKKVSIRITADSIKACVTNGRCHGQVGDRDFDIAVTGETCFTVSVDLQQRQDNDAL